MHPKTAAAGIALLLLVGIAASLILRSPQPDESARIETFEACAAAGYPVTESYPQQCRTPDGRRFTYEPVAPLPMAGAITLHGETTCLTKSGTGPQTLECAIGLLADDGRQYALKNLFALDPELRYSSPGIRVTVTGDFTPETLTGPDGNRYRAVGSVDVASIERAGPVGGPGQAPPPQWIPYRSDGSCPPGYLDYGIPLDCVTPEYLEYCETHACPICLAVGTRIATPQGEIPIENIRPGMVVWTSDADGSRRAAAVLAVSRQEAPAEHRMVRLGFSDGRELLASPGHSTADGRTLASLAAGDAYDGAIITEHQLIPYGAPETFDLLPAGGTGFYWANGVLIGSTLR